MKIELKNKRNIKFYEGYIIIINNYYYDYDHPVLPSRIYNDEDGYMSWNKNGKIHRMGKPAIIYGERKLYYKNGKLIRSER